MQRSRTLKGAARSRSTEIEPTLEYYRRYPKSSMTPSISNKLVMCHSIVRPCRMFSIYNRDLGAINCRTGIGEYTMRTEHLHV